VQRWRSVGLGDRRKGAPKRVPRQLSAEERERLYRTATEQRFQEMTPAEIVPTLLDEGIYLASERTLYRLLKAREALAPRQESRVPVKHPRPSALVATAPNQVWTWDITWLRTEVRGLFKFAYVIEDLFDRSIVGWAVHDHEDPDLAKELFERVIRDLGEVPQFVHADNGGPMKGVALVALLYRLGVGLSYSRPRVSDDNPFIEAFFRTLKYRVGYPRCFTSLQHARSWFADFVTWYNNEHKHSGIQYVTPIQRRRGQDVLILANRTAVLTAARDRNPERWTRSIRNLAHRPTVILNKPTRAA
jgi:putative transposase